jgi:DNA (cytosine-5)-methyltransferase 1
MSVAYYNEHDPHAAAWLRELIKRDLIAPGDVDERPIQDVSPTDLVGYRQCHFFAGIGVWSYALRLAGWPDDQPVWTGSCPCQPFSIAGKGEGFADPRHLWPFWFQLIRECRPSVVFGEQSPSPAGCRWLDLVAADLEAEDYAVGAVDLPACSVGAPHIRQRLWFVGERRHSLPARVFSEWPSPHGLADGDGCGCPPRPVQRSGEAAKERQGRTASGSVIPRFMGDPGSAGLARRSRQSRDDGCQQPAPERAGGPIGGVGDPGDIRRIGGRFSDRGGPDGSGRDAPERESHRDGPAASGAYGGVADANGRNAGAEGLQRGRQHGQRAGDGGSSGLADTLSTGRTQRRSEPGLGPPSRSGEPLGLADAELQPGRSEHESEPGRRSAAGTEHSAKSRGGSEVGGPRPTDGFWRAADWLLCTDGKWRPVEPGTFPLATGAPGRVGRLRGYGNCLVAPLAAEFIAAYREAREGVTP